MKKSLYFPFVANRTILSG